MSYTKRFILGVWVVFLCMAGANAISYLLRLILVRSLLPAEYGLLYAVFGMFGIVSFLQTMGLSDALTNAVPSLRDPRKIKTTLLTVVYAQLMVTGLLALTAILLAPWLAKNYFHSALAQPLIIIYSIGLFLSPLEITMIALYQGFGKTTWYGYFMLLRAALLLLLTWLLLSAGAGLQGVVLAYVLVYLLIPFVHLPVLLRVFPKFRTSQGSFDKAVLVKLLRFGVPIIFTATAGILLTYTDTFFLTLYRSLEEVGLYNVALPTAGLIWFIGGVLYSVVFPLSGQINARKKLGVFKQGMSQLYIYTLILIMPFIITLLLFPDLILNTLFGAEYIAAAVTLQVLVIGGLFYTLNSINAAILSGIGRPKLPLYSIVIAGVVNIIGDILLIPSYGMLGSAVATSIAFLIMFLINLYQIRKFIRFSVDIARLVKLLVSVLFFGLTIYGLRETLALSLWYKIALGAIMGMMVYVLLLFLLRVVTIEEIKNLRRQVMSRG
jgi:stage V sporulation protein B